MPKKVEETRRTVYPSEIEGFAHANHLTVAEAEEHLRGGRSVEDIKAGRVVYRSAYDRVPASAADHPLVAADERRQEQEAEGPPPAPLATVEDKTKPEAGPYGPQADYREVSA